jgi:hypothetical protein
MRLHDFTTLLLLSNACRLAAHVLCRLAGSVLTYRTRSSLPPPASYWLNDGCPTFRMSVAFLNPSCISVAITPVSMHAYTIITFAYVGVDGLCYSPKAARWVEP